MISQKHQKINSFLVICKKIKAFAREKLCKCQSLACRKPVCNRISNRDKKQVKCYYRDIRFDLIGGQRIKPAPLLQKSIA
jgi:hypothetical protein